MHADIPPLSSEASALIPGSRWRHYKAKEGQNYEILCIARVELTGQEVVVYRACFGDMHIWTRPVADFLASVRSDRDVTIKRFTPVIGGTVL